MKARNHPEAERVRELLKGTPHEHKEMYSIDRSQLRLGCLIVTFKDGSQANVFIESPAKAYIREKGL